MAAAATAADALEAADTAAAEAAGWMWGFTAAAAGVATADIVVLGGARVVPAGVTRGARGAIVSPVVIGGETAGVLSPMIVPAGDAETGLGSTGTGVRRAVPEGVTIGKGGWAAASTPSAGMVTVKPAVGVMEDKTEPGVAGLTEAPAAVGVCTS